LLFVFSDVAFLFDLEITLGSILVACSTMLIISLIFDMEVIIIIIISYLAVSTWTDSTKLEN
jgi:hypothetical protein